VHRSPPGTGSSSPGGTFFTNPAGPHTREGRRLDFAVCEDFSKELKS
jgi:hypothetical protein